MYNTAGHQAVALVTVLPGLQQFSPHSMADRAEALHNPLYPKKASKLRGNSANQYPKSIFIRLTPTSNTVNFIKTPSNL